MANPSIYGEIANAIPVIVGGLLAVGGGVISQFATHRLTVRREQRNLRRERLEALVRALFAHQQWLEDRFQALVFRAEDFHAPSPLNEARMIQELHFPELSKEVNNIQGMQLPLIDFMGKERVRRIGNTEWFKTYDSKPYFDAYKSYRDAVNATTAKCRQLLGP